MVQLPNELRDEHCKHVLQRFESVVDGFRKTATRTAVAMLAFFVIFFIPFIKLGYTKAELRGLQESIQSHLESRRQEFNARIAKLEKRREEVRQSERMLARVDACNRAEEALEQLRRDVERDFTFPLEVPALNSLPAELTSAVPIAAAPWSVDWSPERHIDRIAHYRVMLAILGRISVHQDFLEDRIFAPVLAEIDGASRLHTRQEAEEICAALLRLQGRIRNEFEAPLKKPIAESTRDPGTPQNFGLWESYEFEPNAPDRQFSAVLSQSFRETLRSEAAGVTTKIEQLVSNAPWKAALADAWSALGLEKDIWQEIQSAGLSDEDLQGMLEQLNLGESMDVVSERINAIESSTEELQSAADASGVDIWKLAAKLVETLESNGSVEPQPDESMDRLAASVKADAKRRLEKKLPTELEKVKAEIAADERKAADTVRRGMDRLKRKEDALQERLASAGKFLGGLPVGLEDAILLFPVLLAGGFLICCAQFREAARLRDTYGELTRDESTSANTVELTMVLPFPLADADSRALRRIAVAVPFVFQIAALVLLLSFNQGGNTIIVVNSLDEIPAPAVSVSSGVPPTETVASDETASSVDDSTESEPAAVSSASAEELEDSSVTELDSSDANWIYLFAFLVSTFGMIWGTVYAATSLPKQSSEQRARKTSEPVATTDSDSSN